MSDDSAFAIIENAHRIWVIGSIHGEADKLAALHERLFSRLGPGDRLIYLGNYLGCGPAIIETVDEILVTHCYNVKNYCDNSESRKMADYVAQRRKTPAPAALSRQDCA